MATSNPTSYVGQPTAVPGKMVVQSLPTPNLDDRIFVLRVDSRKSDFVLPSQGDNYAGPNASKFSDFVFATAKPCDQLGWYDFFYVNERENQDEYNFEVAYPWADRDYPQYTRTYVVLRDDTRTNEPQADAVDPVHEDLLLVDHKWLRLEDPILDALFIGVQRIYQRLPSPVITSYDLNQAQQVQTIEVQDVVVDDVPTPSATTEVWKVDRKSTAKSTVTTSTVPEVFPDTDYKLEREDRILPFKFRTRAPMETDSHIEAGVAVVPTLAQDDWTAEEHQTTDFKKFVSRSFRSVSLPITLIDYKLDKDQRLVTVTDTWDNGLQTITPTTNLADASVENLGNDESIQSLSTIDGPFESGEFGVKIPDLVPEKFRAAIPIETTALTSTGIAAMQTLGTGELEHSEQQQTDFWKRVTSTGRDVGSLPITLLEYKLTENKQIETISETYDAGLQTITGVDELTVEASVDNLGNNTSLLHVGVVPNLFTEAKYGKRIPDPIPERFRVVVPTATISLLSAGTAIPPTLSTGDLAITQDQITEFVKRTTTEGRAGVSLPVSLTSYKITKDTQLETVVETLDTGLQSISSYLDELLIEGSVDNLGNNTSLLLRGQVPDVFAEAKYTTRIEDAVPPHFRAKVPTFEASLRSAGTALPPDLTGQPDWLSSTETQETEFIKRTEITARPLSGLPVTLVSEKMTRDKQREIVVEVYDNGIQTLAGSLNALTVEAEVQNLGNNTSIATVGQVTSLFTEGNYKVEIPDLVPQEFRPFIPITTSEITSTGIADPNPILGTGDLEVQEHQTDVFNKRVSTISRGNIVLPISHSNKETTTEFGGGNLDKILTLEFTGSGVLDTGYTVLSSKITDLGNGTEIKETTKLHKVGSIDPVWPVLTEYDQDPETQSLITTTYQVVDAALVSAPSIVNGVITRYKKIDRWRSLKVVETYSLPATYEEQRFMAHNFPSLWDWTTYFWSTACGPTGPIREGFSSMVQARVVISFSTTKDTVVGLTLIPNTHHLVHDVVSAVLNDGGTLCYAGTCSGCLTLPPSSPTYSTYLSSIQNTEQLITGESVLWRAGLYKTTSLYVTML